MFDSWIRGLSAHFLSSKGRGQVRRTVRPRVEPLENRRLLTATLLKDVNTTVSDDAFPSEVTEFGGRAFFGGTDGLQPGLYASDGTAAGTTLVKAIPGGVSRLATTGGTLFIAANGGAELWTSDGTAAGTVFVEDNALGRDEFFESRPLVAAGSRVLAVCPARGR